jgi:NAD(P)H dehydrogenase (quinone)
MTKFDGFLFGTTLQKRIICLKTNQRTGIPTRFGNFLAQWKIFWDSTGALWQKGGLWGKYAGLFTSSGTQEGGQESTNLAVMSAFSHH